MLVRLSLVTAAVLLLAHWVIAGRLPRHRLGVSPGESLFEGPNHLGAVNLWHAEGFTPTGRVLVRWWLLTLCGWFAALLVALAAFIAR